MTIATVITRGYGSFGSIGAVILRGYFNGSAPPPPVVTVDTHDLPRHLTKEYLWGLKKRQKALEAKQEEKRYEAEKLRRQIDEARGIYAPEDEPLTVEPQLKEIANEVTGTIYVDKMPQLLAELSAVSQQIMTMEMERQTLIREARRRKDEHEIQIILQALSIH